MSDELLKLMANVLDEEDELLPGEEGFNEPMHVYPTHDIYEHILSLDCKCEPIEDDGIVIHNSFDGREAYERRRRKPH